MRIACLMTWGILLLNECRRCIPVILEDRPQALSLWASGKQQAGHAALIVQAGSIMQGCLPPMRPCELPLIPAANYESLAQASLDCVCSRRA